MRVSCNGCRILRKGCSDNCSIRPCLQWITSPESQANATLFLAKFYGRAGLLNLINAAPQHLRPAVFKSLLYESCGRIVNPVYGSMGLFSMGEWGRCQAAVDEVMMGSEIKPGVAVAASHWQGTDHAFISACDIRHVSRDGDVQVEKKDDVNKVQLKGRARFKRGAGNGKLIKPKPRVGWVDSSALWKPVQDLSESDSVFSGETVEATLVNRAEPVQDENAYGKQNPAAETQTGVDLNLSLG